MAGWMACDGLRWLCVPDKGASDIARLPTYQPCAGEQLHCPLYLLPRTGHRHDLAAPCNRLAGSRAQTPCRAAPQLCLSAARCAALSVCRRAGHSGPVVGAQQDRRGKARRERSAWRGVRSGGARIRGILILLAQARPPPCASPPPPLVNMGGRPAGRRGQSTSRGYEHAASAAAAGERRQRVQHEPLHRGRSRQTGRLYANVPHHAREHHRRRQSSGAAGGLPLGARGVSGG